MVFSYTQTTGSKDLEPRSKFPERRDAAKKGGLFARLRKPRGSDRIEPARTGPDRRRQRFGVRRSVGST
jgi:hypothetical protein